MTKVVEEEAWLEGVEAVLEERMSRKSTEEKRETDVIALKSPIFMVYRYIWSEKSIIA